MELYNQLMLLSNTMNNSTTASYHQSKMRSTFGHGYVFPLFSTIKKKKAIMNDDLSLMHLDTVTRNVFCWNPLY